LFKFQEACKLVRLGAFACVFIGATLSSAQISRIHLIHKQATPTKLPVIYTLAPSDSNTLNFDTVGAGYVNLPHFAAYSLNLKKNQTLKSISLTNTDFKFENDPDCQKPDSGTEKSCLIVFGYLPTVTQLYTETVTFTIHDNSPNGGDSTPSITLTGNGVAPQAQVVPAPPCTGPTHELFPTAWPSVQPQQTGSPQSTQSEAQELAVKVGKDLGYDLWNHSKEEVINCFYQTDNQLAFFTQFESIYNAASGSATIIANIGSFNFNNGMQVSLGTNVQTGTSSPASSTPASGTLPPPPTLTAAAAAQASQNLFYGGNFYAYGLYPIFSRANLSPTDRWDFEAAVVAREGVDLQNFGGTSTVATSPATHFNIFGEGYYQYDANPLTPSSTTVPLAIFVGGQYGYEYTSRSYAREYGFGAVSTKSGFLPNPGSKVGDLSAGFLVSGAVQIAVSREFGPSQTYIDSVTGLSPPVNNFKSWSFAIQYQSKGLSATQ